MRPALLLFLGFFLAFQSFGSAQEVKRGTIKIKKPGQIKYVISKATNAALPQQRVFRVRYYNYNFKEYFPKEYKSELFPLMFNYRGLILADANQQWSDNVILSYDYELFKSQVQCQKGNVSGINLNHPFRQLSYMVTGSSVWIKNLVYKDKYGVIHEKEIGEFKVEKVK